MTDAEKLRRVRELARHWEAGAAPGTLLHEFARAILLTLDGKDWESAVESMREWNR